MSQNNDQFLGSIEFSSKMDGKYQFLYSSQLYETIFGVYGIFYRNGDGSINSIKLSILNYKGTIDLGFHNEVKPICSYEPEIDPKTGNIVRCVVKLKIELKAMVSGLASYITEETTIDNSLGDIVKIPASDSLFFEVERELDPMWAHLPCSPPMHPKLGVFDSEFFYRDGTHYERREVTEVPDYYYETDRNKVYPDIDWGQKPGFKCKNSILRVVR